MILRRMFVADERNPSAQTLNRMELGAPTIRFNDGRQKLPQIWRVSTNVIFFSDWCNNALKLKNSCCCVIPQPILFQCSKTRCWMFAFSLTLQTWCPQCIHLCLHVIKLPHCCHSFSFIIIFLWIWQANLQEILQDHVVLWTTNYTF